MIDLIEVDLQDVSTPIFPNRFNRDDRPLLTSIQNFGVKNPPSLLKRGKEYLIIDGWARIDIVKKMDKAKLPCFVYDEQHLNEKNAFLLSLELNSWTRDFNLVEKALVLKSAIEIYGGIKIPKTFWQVAGIKENIRSIHQYKDLLRLPKFIQKHAVSNNIPLSVILIFLKFSKDQTEALAKRLFILPLNQNKLAEILGLLLDITKREDSKAIDVVESAFFEIESKQEYNAVQKEQMLRRILHKKRNPHYEKQLKKFEDKVKKIPVNKTTKITPAPFFEDDYIEVSTKFQTFKDLEDFKNSLEYIGWSNLFDNE